MAYTTINVAYDGKNTREWYTTLFNRVDSFEFFQPVLGNKTAVKIPNLSVGNLLQASACNLTPTSGLTMAEKTVSVCKIEIYQPLCTDEFENMFISEYQKAGANNSDIPSLEATFIENAIRDSIQDSIEKIVWLGDTASGDATLKLCDGLRKKLVSTSYSGSVVTVTAMTVSSSNVIVEMAKVKSAAPSVIKDSKDRVFLVSSAIFDALETYQATQAIARVQDGVTQNNRLYFVNIPVVRVPSMADNEMLLTVKNNLVWSSDMISDSDEILMLDQRKVTARREVIVSARFFLGFEIKFPQYIVFYK